MVYNFIDSHKDIITVQFGETVKDANGNHVTFKAKGVMDYTVDFR